jgi:hypothetical protein
MNKKFQFVLISKLLVIGSSILFVLAACSGPEDTKSTVDLSPEAEIQITQSEPIDPTKAPTATNTEAPTATVEGYPVPALTQNIPEQGIDEGYPAPQTELPTTDNPEEAYPSPEEISPPPLKTELEATDPSEVNLASGDLQLIEFFAFW